MANGALSGLSLRSRALMIVLLAATGWPARANDSAAELSIGGLQFVRTKDVAMASEELRIGLDRVSVRYQFVNQTSKPVALTVAFPLPDIDLSEAENIAFPSSDPVNFVAFETRIDGNAVPRDRSKLLPGDLLTFGRGKSVSHVGIYLGEGRFIHASVASRKIIETTIDRNPRLFRRWQGARRLIATDDSTKHGES